LVVVGLWGVVVVWVGVGVVLGADGAEPPMPEDARVTIARDATADEGPLRGLAAGLAVAEASWAIVAGGDMPDLQTAVLEEMLRAARETGAVAVALSDGGRARPLPLVVATGPAREAVPLLLEEGRRSLRQVLDAVRTVVVDEPTWTAIDPDRRTLEDVDEPADLDAGRRRGPSG
jgi:molybdopterin-guanine dinucleotide biosynthesis protein A